MKRELTFDSIPSSLDEVLGKLDQVIGMLSNRVEKPEEIPKFLNVENALQYFQRIGYPMKKSTLYKLSAAGKIPFRKDGSILVFITAELDDWCLSALNCDQTTNCNYNIVKSARKGTKNQNYDI